LLSKEDIKTLCGNFFTWEQKKNYLKYIFSRPSKILKYKPITISIVGTGRCTLGCDMCPTHSKIVPEDYEFRQYPAKDISFDTFKKVVDTFSEALNVHIIGSGEPLLNNGLFDMIDYAACKKHMIVKTFSNGTTISRNISKILSSKLDGITISLNGHDRDEFQRMTGMAREVYDRIFAAAKELISERNRTHSKVKVKLAFIVDTVNYKSLGKMIDAGMELGADVVFLCNFLPAPYPGLTADERMIFLKNTEIIRFMKNVQARLDERTRRKISFPDVVNPEAVSNECRAHFTQIRVDGDGRVGSCSVMLLNMGGKGYFYEPDVWNNKFFQDMREIFLKNNKSLLKEPCRACPENFGVRIDA
jgi:MoaA/NifB/PqqE/SkfB family radical SAM enzyme